jgi:hypothetical protein
MRAFLVQIIAVQIILTRKGALPAEQNCFFLFRREKQVILPLPAKPSTYKLSS